jgi:hypothetical protein
MRLAPRRAPIAASPIASFTLALASLVGTGIGVSASGCGLRQNLRNEFVSYRGAWFCEKKDCAEKDMKRSAKGHNEGDSLRIMHGKLQPRAALAFNPGKPVVSFSAKVADCKGKEIAVPDGSVKAPGSHDLSGEGESWVVVLDRAELSDLTIENKGSCAILKVTTHATWEKGTSYDERGGIQVEG